MNMAHMVVSGMPCNVGKKCSYNFVKHAKEKLMKSVTDSSLVCFATGALESNKSQLVINYNTIKTQDDIES